jgi:hypothetical protein
MYFPTSASSKRIWISITHCIGRMVLFPSNASPVAIGINSTMLSLPIGENRAISFILT